MPEPKCPTCGWRKKYDDNPNSFLGKLWRWHAHVCPGWKAYMKTLSDQERKATATKYQIKKYMN